MSFHLPDPAESAAAPTQSRSTTPPNFSSTTPNVSTTPTGHSNLVLPRAGTYGTVQLSLESSSPQRNPTLASTTNGQFSVHADEDRDQLRNELQNRIHVTNLLEPSSDNFWEEILSTRAVSEATVTRIRNAIQVDINHLCKLANKKNPLEDDMYPPLTRIFGAIKPGDHTKERKVRFWKDHHTKYPGVDPEVLISGLHAQGEGVEGTSMAAEGVNIQAPFKIRRIGTESITSNSPSAGASDDVDRHDPRSEDGEYKHKVSSKPGTTRRVIDARKPDWVLLDGDSAGRMPENPLWRQIAVILELKANRLCAPTKGKPESSLIVLCADYARLHLALRPFQSFSIHFSLCGNLFTAWLIDRVGVIISDTLDISTDQGADTFIRALVQATTDLTMYELGMDPTVAIEEGSSPGDFKMPRFKVAMPSGNLYMTKGPPIWQSSSLFGRGTVVWKVEEQISSDKDGLGTARHVPTKETLTPMAKPELILKSAYRHLERIGESEFYAAINRAKHPGIATFLEGGDVMYRGEKVTNARHRHGLTPSAQDSVAHRLVLKSRGRRLSEYGSFHELLKAVLASVRGHEALFKYGILHRDISIGNVFISDEPDVSPGFLGDLDMAKVYDASRLAELIGDETAGRMIRNNNLGSITGTAQFMALSLLKQYDRLSRDQMIEATQIPDLSRRRRIQPLTSRKARASDRANPTPKKTNTEDKSMHSSNSEITAQKAPNPTPPGLAVAEWSLVAKNDLESFIWVMFYAVCVKQMNLKPAVQGQGGRSWYCHKLFMPLFGGVSFQNTYKAHFVAADDIVDTNTMSVWKQKLIPHPHFWDILGELLKYARSGELDYALFQDLLEYYISQEEEFMEEEKSLQF